MALLIARHLAVALAVLSEISVDTAIRSKGLSCPGICIIVAGAENAKILDTRTSVPVVATMHAPFKSPDVSLLPGESIDLDLPNKILVGGLLLKLDASKIILFNIFLGYLYL